MNYGWRSRSSQQVAAVGTKGYLERGWCRVCGNRRCGLSEVPLLDWGGGLVILIQDQVPRLRTPLEEEKCMRSLLL